MAYIGRSVDVGIFEKQVLTPDSTTTSFALTYAVGSANSLFVVYGGVVQEPGVAYSVSGGGQTIVFSEAPATGTTLYIIYYGKQLTTPRAAGQETTKQTFSGDGTTTVFTLTDPPVVPAGIMVFVDGILQREGSGNNFISSGSTINFTTAPDSGSEIDVYTLVKEKVSIDTVADGSITRAKLAASHPYWDASGNFGIGVASPTQKLNVYGADGANNVATFSRSGGATLYTYVDSGNNVGIFCGSNASGGGFYANAADSSARIMAGAAERMRISSTGVVGIGTQTAGALNGCTLEVAHTGSDGLLVSRATKYISLNGNYSDGNIHSRITSSNSNISFATGGDNARAWITPNGIALGSSIGANTTGTGISFPSTQNASTDPNTLDDYEEGTFSPTLGGNTDPSSITYTQQRGIYTKIGRQVNIQLYVAWSSKSGGSGLLLVRGLPFVVGEVGFTTYPSGTVNEINGITFPSGKTFITTEGKPSSAVLGITASASGVSSVDVQLSDAGASGYIICSLAYATN